MSDLDEFRSEAREILDQLSADLVALERAPEDVDLVNAIFRGAHSLKGLAAMLGLTAISRLAHRLETVLDGIRMGRIAIDGEVLDPILAGADLLGRMVEAAAQGLPEVDGGKVRELSDRIAALSTHRPARTGSIRRLDPEVARALSDFEAHRAQRALDRGQRLWRLEVTFPFESFDRDLPAAKERLKSYGEVVATLAGDLSRSDRMSFGLLVASEKDPSVLVVAAAVPEARISELPVLTPSTSRPSQEARAFQGFEPSGGAWSALPAGPASSLGGAEVDWASLAGAGSSATVTERVGAADRPSAGGTVRVNLERVDGLLDLVGELFDARNAIGRVVDKLKGESGGRRLTLEAEKASRLLSRRLDDLQKGILQVRMLPLEPLFQRLQRVVRGLARESGKEVELVTEGARTELDKVMIDEISDPLIHLLRNAVDHGIEEPERRAAAGKPRQGVIRIAASPKGNQVAIEVSDDGRGLELEKIRARAVERGLLAREARPTDEELIDFIFAPGFSTKDVVTEVSGRGVGMDVVKNNIMRLSGMIDTRSEPGRGTRFTLRLPLTLAALKALLVEVGGQTFAVPVASIQECLRLESRQVRVLDGRESVVVRDMVVPLLRLGRFFGREPVAADRLELVVVGLAQYRLGLAVEGLGAQLDLVVKPLGAPLDRLPGIMGGTSLGEGGPILVVDVPGLVGRALGLQERRGEVRA